jgi:hypothetical protein
MSATWAILIAFLITFAVLAVTAGAMWFLVIPYLERRFYPPTLDPTSYLPPNPPEDTP